MRIRPEEGRKVVSASVQEDQARPRELTGPDKMLYERFQGCSATRLLQQRQSRLLDDSQSRLLDSRQRAASAHHQLCTGCPPTTINHNPRIRRGSIRSFMAITSARPREYDRGRESLPENRRGARAGKREDDVSKSRGPAAEAT